MSDKIEYSRIRIKRTDNTGIVPTIPTGNTLNEMIDTDLFVGEFFLNTTDDKLWIRSDSGIIELQLSGGTGYTQTLSQTLSNGNITDGNNIFVSYGDRIYSSGGTSYVEFDKAGIDLVNLVSQGLVGLTTLGLNSDQDFSLSFSDGLVLAQGVIDGVGWSNTYGNTIDKLTTINQDLEYINLSSNNVGDGYDCLIQIDGQNAQIFEQVGDTSYNNFSKTTRQIGVIEDYCGDVGMNDYTSVSQNDSQVYSLVVSGGTERTKWKIKDNQISGSTTDGVDTTTISLTPTTFDLHNSNEVGIRNTSSQAGNETLILEGRRWIVNRLLSSNVGSYERANKVTTVGATTTGSVMGGTLPTGSTGYLETRITASNATGSKGYFARIIGVYRRDNTGNYYQIGTNDVFVQSNFTTATSTLTYSIGSPPSVDVTGETGETITWSFINKWGNDVTYYI